MQTTPSQPPHAPATTVHTEISQIEQELHKFAQLKQQLEDCKKRHQLLLALQVHEGNSTDSHARMEKSVEDGLEKDEDEAVKEEKRVRGGEDEKQEGGMEQEEAKEHGEEQYEEGKQGRAESNAPTISEEKSNLQQQIQTLSALKKNQLPHIKQLYAKIVHLKQSLL